MIGNDIEHAAVSAYLSIRNELAVRSEEQAKKVPKIFLSNEIARNKICSVDLLNGGKLDASSTINLNFVNKYLLFVRIN